MPIEKIGGEYYRGRPRSSVSKSKTIPKGFLENLLDEQKLKYCFECGACTASCPVAEVLPKYYNPRRLVNKIFFNLERTLVEDELWLCAWCYRCYERCPQGVKLPEIFASVKSLATRHGIFQGFREAVELIKKEVPLPAVCSQICFHFERGNLDESLVTGTLKSFVEDYELKMRGVLEPKAREEKIAIIGSGPAGLAAAWELIKKGYLVTIFEALSEPGGMLRVGIPSYRLSKDLLDAEIAYLQRQGVEIRTATSIGKDLAMNDLTQKGYKAVFIATGAHKSRRLHIEGEELSGVFHALDLLGRINLGEKVELGNRVVVIGGGNVAVDVARTSLRLGSKKAVILYRRSREEMPANPWEVKEAEKEGVEIQFLLTPKRILGEGKVTGIECIRMTLEEPDETGRRRPIPIEGSEFILELDTVILAVGESPDLSFLPKGIEVTENDTIVCNPVTLETSLLGVFAGGDAVSGPATVIEAIAAGKKIAHYIDRYIRGEHVE